MKIYRNTIYFGIAVLFLTACNQGGSDSSDSSEFSLNTEKDKLSYSFGVSIGKNMKQQNFDSINFAALSKGMEDIYNSNELLISEEEAGNIISADVKKRQQSSFSANMQAARQFLEANKSQEGVVVLPSGLQYKVLTEGTGPKPTPTDTVTVHYHGSLIDGTVFDSSVERGEPVSFPVGGVIQGWQEALQLMNVGSKWKLFIPSNLAYGANPRPGGVIEPNMALVFEVELISIAGK